MPKVIAIRLESGFSWLIRKTFRSAVRTHDWAFTFGVRVVVNWPSQHKNGEQVTKTGEHGGHLGGKEIPESKPFLLGFRFAVDS
jgi:hypothetical protein